MLLPCAQHARRGFPPLSSGHCLGLISTSPRLPSPFPYLLQSLAKNAFHTTSIRDSSPKPLGQRPTSYWGLSGAVLTPCWASKGAPARNFLLFLNVLSPCCPPVISGSLSVSSSLSLGGLPWCPGCRRKVCLSNPHPLGSPAPGARRADCRARHSEPEIWMTLS